MPVSSDLLLNFVRGDRLSAIANTFDARTDAMIAVAEQIRAAFDLDTGTGIHLDRIGQIVQLARVAGQSDDAYRLLLQVQVELILPSSGRPGSLQRIAELITGAAPIGYSEFYPRTVRIRVLDDGTADIALLLSKLRQAVIGAVRVVVSAASSNALIMSYTPANPVDGAGTLSYTPADPVADAGLVGYEFPT